jgi:glycine oxidase
VSTHQIAQQTEVAVIGGGVIGLAVAWRAAQAGHRVTVLERDRVGGGATSAAAGMIAPISEATYTERPLLELGMASARRYPDFLAELADATGHDAGLRTKGTLLVARDRDEAEALDRMERFRNDLGLPVERLLPSAARRLEPAFAPTLRRALLIADDHVLDPRRLAADLALAATGAGAQLREGVPVEAIAIGSGGDRVEGAVLAGGERVAADRVVLCAGAWMDGVDGIPAERRVPVRPVKGQILRLRDPSGPGLLDRVVRMPLGPYVVPRNDGRYVLGATMEERGFDQAVTVGAVHDMLRDAAELIPGLLELEIEEFGAGLRPATPDSAPAIGAWEPEGLVWATGHYRHGVLLAPITADAVVAALAGDPLPEPAHLFGPERFASPGSAVTAVGTAPAEGAR